MTPKLFTPEPKNTGVSLAARNCLVAPCGGGAHGQLHALHGVVEGLAEARAQPVLVAQRDGLEVLRARSLPGSNTVMLCVRRSMMPPKDLALAHGPGHGAAGHAELALHLVEDVERVAHLAVHLVDEGDDGRVALAADLDQAARLRLHAVGGVDHHQGRVHGREYAVGVFREVLVAGGVEQVDDVVAVLHLHHRRGHRDAALLFDLHPVRGGMAAGLAALDGAGDLDRAREQQQLFRQRRFTRVGVGNDGKGAAAPGFGGVGHKEFQKGVRRGQDAPAGVRKRQFYRAGVVRPVRGAGGACGPLPL
jgi:hypothetical protein